ncbi:signal transduction histidine kinase (sthk) with cheb and cher activity [Stigmatella aurantiaca DW4/3-1]|uniref:Signal transduction histidine kinase (Sthk) with cheb and cher activity n=1 Tax=Stigmatella aurantiaca (strain DW4/3-1) TaxID=378806 RepID=Q09AQ0_STIAD|nr:signal transduction histidine kinase (sthk) with cheb and cher activity [Stigmatella aurantiaca DW4/3-1]
MLRKSFPVVGIGASAGGLEAFTQLLALLPPGTGMSFVFIQHLSATHTSFLREALSKATQMPVIQARDGMRVEPNHLYVIPPGADMEIADDALSLRARVDEAHKPHLPIDIFLRSLAAARGSQSIGVILSGTASDGTEGLRAIKEESGITLAQDPRSAKFGEMPQSAVQAGVVDLSLALPQLAQELIRLSQHAYPTAAQMGRPRYIPDSRMLARLFALVRDAVGIDFSEYKSATFERRLARRMALRRMESLSDYVKLLEQTPGEARALYEDILIHVTAFFRDPEAFEALKTHVFPVLLKRNSKKVTFRLWVAGCSTGEEVYSLAISLVEFLEEAQSQGEIQIFGSDISEQAIEKARAGLYPESALQDLSKERKARFFTQTEGGYRISKAVRELCVFVRHDLARDPPFSKLDLVSCRNVLIYFIPELQKRALATFHYCLNDPGFLLLGRTENVSGLSPFFTPVDKAQKLLARVTGSSRLRFSRGAGLKLAEKPVVGRAALAHARPPLDEVRRIDRLLLSRYAPPGVVINDKLEILQFRGHTGPYLEQTPGEPQFNILKMAREGLLSPLRLALAQAKKQDAPTRVEGVRLDQNGTTSLCDIVVVPIEGLPGQEEPLKMVVFEEGDLSGKRVKKPFRSETASPAKARDAVGVTAMKRELAATRDYLQSLLEEHGRTNDALASTNEELVSGNEELQSLNEELETAKEELQSTNEELTTVNDELHSRNQELNLANGDLVNLLDTVDIPVIILDLERRIRRFTPKARSIMNVLPSDVGRPLEDITLNVSVPDLGAQVAEVMKTARVREFEVQNWTGHWFRMHLRPYKTPENRIDGAILSLVDIDALKHQVSQVEWARDDATGIVEAVQVPLVVLDGRMRLLSANKAFYQAYPASAAETVAKSLFELSGGAWDVPELRAALGQMLAKNTFLEGLELEHVFAHVGKRRMSLSARSVHSRTGLPMLLLAIEDITERKQRELERAELLAHAQQAKEEAERANRAKDQFLATLSHELRTPLSTMLMQAQLLRRGTMDDAKIKRASEAIERSTKMQVQLIDDLLDVSRIVTGKLRMEFQTVHLPGVVQAALESVSAQAERKSILFETTLDESLGPVSGDPTRLQQIVWNLLANAIKFSAEGQRVSVVLERMEGSARLQVSDRGAGIEAEALQRIFDRFMQEDSSSTRVFGGLGLGLAIVRHLVELHGGTVQAESPGKGQGAIFTVILPLMPVRLGQTGAARPDEPEHTRGSPGPQNAGVSSRLKGLRILVVDDEPGTRESAAELLGQAGAEVRTAESVVTALALLQDFMPEVLLSDVAMPGQDGYTLIRAVRALSPERGGNIPAIALTALVGDADRRAVLSAGFQRHLAKPIDIDRLMDAVEETWVGAASLKAGSVRGP